MPMTPRALSKSFSVVAEEMPALDAGERHRLPPAARIEDHGEGARLPREDDAASVDGREGHVMPAVGQVDAGDERARLVDQHSAVTATGLFDRGREHEFGLFERRGTRRQQRRDEPRARSFEEGAALPHLSPHPARRSRPRAQARR
jgi:hypothetical protein